MLEQLLSEYEELTKASLLAGLTPEGILRAKQLEYKILRLQTISCPVITKKAS